VAETVPLGPALERHDDDVVGAADVAVVEHARVRIGPGAGHKMNRIKPAECRVFALPALRPVLIVVERK
jgi:hypothetical protein